MSNFQLPDKGCRYRIDETESLGLPVIRFCSMHAAAPQMIDEIERLRAELAAAEAREKGLVGALTAAAKVLACKRCGKGDNLK